MTIESPRAAAAPSRVDSTRELIATVQRLALARSLPDVQAIVRTAARRLTGADGATFVLRDEGRCYYADEDAISPLWKGQRFPMSSCISGWAMLNRRPAAIEDIYADDRIPHAAYRPTFVKSLAMVPIRTLDPIGAIGNYWAQPHQPSDEEIEVLQALADSTAVAMENVRALTELSAARLETLRRLALAAEFRDDATFEHTRRVARTAGLIARRLGLDDEDVELLELAAPLHDLGKLAVSDTVLLKPGRLDEAELLQIRAHPAAGAAILEGSSSDVLRLAREIALTHHEWWDGSGYPAGLAGVAIPLPGRIVALADVFDALVHPRPYKAAWPLERAVAEVRSLAGRQFDPAVVDAFLDLDPQELVGPLPATPA
jgi:HD-GYP domain-containing protein (c-di-GMP phosphodiesterase class II)